MPTMLANVHWPWKAQRFLRNSMAVWKKTVRHAPNVQMASETLRECAKSEPWTVTPTMMQENAKSAATNTPWSSENASTTACWAAKLRTKTIHAGNATNPSCLKITTATSPTARPSTTTAAFLVNAVSSSLRTEDARSCLVGVWRSPEEFALNAFPTTNWPEESARSRDAFPWPTTVAQTAKQTTT